ncbi:M20/M25/M40 family metallo-hydrolase [Microvirga roseola]|uniref:M20/M25/M40 family metallo-hydrolase n=1 Tax=Microvirga roseola TaxID=2883126 RepID=UPI001E3BE435|nr:M20/M25/M40 family metallo-hydrolase [Microvirga roseola]
MNWTNEEGDRWTWGGSIFDSDLAALIRSLASALGYSHRGPPSQVGHDMYLLAGIRPTAMIFTPCRDGITHNNAELATLEDIAPGAMSCCTLLSRAGR